MTKSSRSILFSAALAGVLTSTSIAAASAPPSTAAAKAGIDKTLGEVNRLLARGTNAQEIANALYDDDLQITIEGVPPFWHNLKTFLPKLGDYVQAPCTLTAIDPIRADGKLAVAFVSEICPATAKDPAEKYRILYVFRNTPRGWRVTMESAMTGIF